MTHIANTDMAAAWDGDEGAGWADNAERYERAGRRIWEHFLKHVPIGPADVVLDIGCGTGRSTRAIARLASAGSALGIDLSTRMLAHARTSAERDGIPNVRFEQADAQVHPFQPEAFDLAISSFGCMFFADPVAAYRNIGSALKPRGRLALLAWRDVASNEWIVAVRDALAVGRELPMPPPHAPGPFAFADPDHVRRVLTEAGFGGVRLDEIDSFQELGADAADAFSFVRTMGVVRGLTQDLDEELRAQALDAVQEALAAHETPDGVLFGAAAWLITASASPDDQLAFDGR